MLNKSGLAVKEIWSVPGKKRFGRWESQGFILLPRRESKHYDKSFAHNFFFKSIREYLLDHRHRLIHVPCCRPFYDSYSIH